jgi:hypothetical protein
MRADDANAAIIDRSPLGVTQKKNLRGSEERLPASIVIHSTDVIALRCT